MDDNSHVKKFYCPHCGVLGSIYVLQLKRNKIIIKQKCPKHSGRKYKIPIQFKDRLFPLIQKAIFRCHYCGKPTWIDQIKD
ncbi:MAG: hypothetical protein GF317_22895 [Candidatus Lokiarchaeota archaeon]|nr:hypothetical protein [Candidatus Lokiarchaeota archaeon]MBD3202295.1 hypothetical protein [Candidatus Lokiarchaeota archaeon]